MRSEFSSRTSSMAFKMHYSKHKLQLEKYFLSSMTDCNLYALLLKDTSNKATDFQARTPQLHHISNSSLNCKVPFQNRNGNMNACYIFHSLQGLLKC